MYVLVLTLCAIEAALRGYSNVIVDENFKADNFFVRMGILDV